MSKEIGPQERFVVVGKLQDIGSHHKRLDSDTLQQVVGSLEANTFSRRKLHTFSDNDSPMAMPWSAANVQLGKISKILRIMPCPSLTMSLASSRKRTTHVNITGMGGKAHSSHSNGRSIRTQLCRGFQSKQG